MYWLSDDGHIRHYSELTDALACAVEMAVIEGRSGRKVEVTVYAQPDPKENSFPVYSIIAYPNTNTNTGRLELPSLTIVNTH